MKTYIIYGDTTRHRGSQRCDVIIGELKADNSRIAYELARRKCMGDYTNIKIRLKRLTN